MLVVVRDEGDNAEQQAAAPQPPPPPPQPMGFERVQVRPPMRHLAGGKALGEGGAQMSCQRCHTWFATFKRAALCDGPVDA